MQIIQLIQLTQSTYLCMYRDQVAPAFSALELELQIASWRTFPPLVASEAYPSSIKSQKALGRGHAPPLAPCAAALAGLLRPAENSKKKKLRLRRKIEDRGQRVC